MVYGVDLPTEIAYTYRISDSKDPGPPILDEIFYEEPARKDKVKGKDAGTGVEQGRASSGPCSGDDKDEAACERERELNADSFDREGEFHPLADDWINLMESADFTETADFGVFDSGISTSAESVLGKKNMKALAVSKIEEKRKESDGEQNVPKRKGNNEVYAVKAKKSFSQSQRRFVRSEDQVHSGDNTVPYVSLSHAHKWLEDDSGSSSRDVELNKKWTERRPEVTHRNLFDTWATLKMASAVTTVDPAVDMFHSVRANGDTTVVMEMAGVDHLDVAKHPYVHFLLFENLLMKMAKELCLNETDTACDKQYSTKTEAKKSFFSFPEGTPDVQLLSRKITQAAGQVVKTMKEKYHQ